MEIQTGSVDFSSPLSGSGPRTGQQTVIFSRNVTSAAVGITGYFVGYAPTDDHHVGQIQIKVEPTINANVVIVTATLGLRDWSGNWDDPYQGSIDFAVVADLEPVTGPPPRGDLLITGMEFNQAVQFFRSGTYLDPVNSLPDNAIPMVARKNTGIRVYVDYDASSGLPVINNLTGQLIVRTATTTFMLSPINPGGSISPHRDSTTNLGVPDQTLNFMIPAALCQGVVTVTCRVWDASSPGSTSPMFYRTVEFTDVKPLNLYIVGITYGAVNPSIPAPTQAAFTSTALPGLTKTYPVGDIVQTGYATIQFNTMVTGTASNGGCTSGFNSLVDRLYDMRGGSDDIYVGVLPAGILGTPGNQGGGCGNEGIAAIFIDYGGLGDLPHECGHALKLEHVPPTPGDVDPNYPQYGAFPTGSIGVFGFDPTSDQVFSPAIFLDFMSYGFPQWVSAYTYKHLSGILTPIPGSGAAVNPLAFPPSKAEMLRLRIIVSRDRTVTRVPSFHHTAPAQGPIEHSCFTAELLDESKHVLVCQPLASCCGSTCDCWPKRAAANIPWSPASRWLRIWEADKMIYEEAIPDPPTVKIHGSDSKADGLHLKWSAKHASKADKGHLWYVVHWFDREFSIWRGVAPSQQETSLVIPSNLFVSSDLRIRVLATSGIATGYAEADLKSDKPQGPNHEIVLVGHAPGAPEGPYSANQVLHAIAVDPSGRQASTHSLVWYDNNGAQIGRGSHVDLRSLPVGQHVVRVVFRHSHGHLTSKSWLIEKSHAAIKVHHAIPDPSLKPRAQHKHPHPKP
jgi:hypothetical protein